MKTSEYINNALWTLRLKAKQLSKLIGAGEPTISAWRNGKADISWEYYQRIEKLLREKLERDNG